MFWHLLMISLLLACFYAQVLFMKQPCCLLWFRYRMCPFIYFSKVLSLAISVYFILVPLLTDPRWDHFICLGCVRFVRFFVVVFSFLEENGKTPTCLLTREFYPLVHLLELYKISIRYTDTSKAWLQERCDTLPSNTSTTITALGSFLPELLVFLVLLAHAVCLWLLKHIPVLKETVK